MKKVLVSGIGAIALMCTAAVPGLAADLPRRAAPAPMYTPVPVYNWTGFYIGANLGGAWTSVDVVGNWGGARWSSVDTSNFIIGGQLGYNYQIDRFVIGVEGDFDWANGSKTSGFRPTVFGPLQAIVDSNWVATVAARLGYAADNWLFYAKLGGGWTRVDAQLRNPAGGVFANGSSTNSGWLVGAGIEYAFAQHWTAKIEYNYLGLSDKTFRTVVAPNTLRVSPDIQMVKVGINYKF